MKALSIKQPYLNQIQTGKKYLELRSWKTNYRGALILCSSKKPAQPTPELLHGHALCVVELIDIYPYLPRHAKAACSTWNPGLYAWHLKFVANLDPFPVSGKLGLFKL